MSFTNNDIHNAAGPGSSAEPSMEEILASIRRILKEDDPGKLTEPAAAPVEMDEDVLLLDQSMIARPADVSTATSLPPEPAPIAMPPPAPPQSTAEPLHFSSEPVPFSRDVEPVARAMPTPVVELPPVIEPDPEPLPPPIAAVPLREPEPYRPLQPPPATFYQPIGPEPDPFPPAPPPEPPPYRPASHAFLATPPPEPPPAPEPYRPLFAAPPPPYRPAPDPIPTEPDMSQPSQDGLEPPQSIISDKTTDAAASSIGALVRSMSLEKSVAVTKNSPLTIEDIVREEIRPLLKAWMDTHLPTLVERVVRSEIERVINRSVV